jgi:hypothetical protein
MTATFLLSVGMVILGVCVLIQSVRLDRTQREHFWDLVKHNDLMRANYLYPRRMVRNQGKEVIGNYLCSPTME